jgi:hypothetical protein
LDSFFRIQMGVDNLTSIKRETARQPCANDSMVTAVDVIREFE